MVCWLAVLSGMVMITAGVSAQSAPVVRALAVTPEPADSLAPSQSLNVRVAYESGQPLRFQAAGYRDGQKVDRFSMNASPVFAAGTGEASVWIAAQAGEHIDEVRVQVFDARWQSVLEVPVPVRAAWREGVTHAPEAAWAREMSLAQSRMISEDRNEPPPDTGILGRLWTVTAIALVPICFAAVPGYPVLQFLAWKKLRGRARLMATLPLAFMAPVYTFCAYALTQQSNLWPIYAIFASPAALLITGVAFWAGVRRERGAAARHQP